MIPRSHLTQWSQVAPWPDIRQVEQDLVICRALCDVFNHPGLAGKITFRGGTAIHKLLFRRPLRYSEDIDLVQTQVEPIGTIVDHLRDALSWLGKCNRDHAQHSMHMTYKFHPATKLRALLQRNKSRDLFDLYRGLIDLELSPERLVACFLRYMEQELHPVSRAIA